MTYINSPSLYPAPQGWVCPKCQAVFSPTTPMCLNCKPVKQGNTIPATSEARP